MKSLSAIARELDVSVAAVSYVYNNKWRENRIHPDLAGRISRRLREERAAPDPLGRQLQSGRTQTVGLLLPHLEQPYFLKLLAGIEQRLGESDYMVLLGGASRGRRERQVRLVERMLARRADALLMCPRPAQGLNASAASIIRAGRTPVVFVDNYLPDCPAARAISDNRWGAKAAVRKMLSEGRRRILFLGGNAMTAALRDRFLGYCDALAEAGLKREDSLTLWRDKDRAALERLRLHLAGPNRPDALFVTSFFQFPPVLELLDGLGIRHPQDVLLGGFDEPMENWTQDAVRRVIRAPLLAVRQRAAEMGRAAAEFALAAIDGENVQGRERLIRPSLSWEEK